MRTITPDISFEGFEDRATEAAQMLKALSNEKRLMILCKLLEHGEMSVNALIDEVGLSQSAMSQHLARMTAFAGANMLQSSVTGFCPAAIVFKKLGCKAGNAFR